MVIVPFVLSAWFFCDVMNFPSLRRTIVCWPMQKINRWVFQRSFRNHRYSAKIIIIIIITWIKKNNITINTQVQTWIWSHSFHVVEKEGMSLEWLWPVSVVLFWDLINNGKKAKEALQNVHKVKGMNSVNIPYEYQKPVFRYKYWIQRSTLSDDCECELRRTCKNRERWTLCEE